MLIHCYFKQSHDASVLERQYGGGLGEASWRQRCGMGERGDLRTQQGKEKVGLIEAVALTYIHYYV